jgi:hypothetical protein
MGPAKVGPEGAFFLVGGTTLSEHEWRRHPAVVAVRGAPEAEDS